MLAILFSLCCSFLWANRKEEKEKKKKKTQTHRPESVLYLSRPVCLIVLSNMFVPSFTVCCPLWGTPL